MPFSNRTMEELVDGTWTWNVLSEKSIKSKFDQICAIAIWNKENYECKRKNWSSWKTDCESFDDMSVFK